MGQVITDVGIDLDGVVYPFMEAFRGWCSKKLGDYNLPDPTHWNFYEDWGLDEETFKTYVKEAATVDSIFKMLSPYDGTVQAWRDLRDLNIRIHVLTARPHSAWVQTIDWLSVYGLHCDSLHFTNTKSMLSKLNTGKALLIDDHIAYYEEAERNNIVPVLMTRPWNLSRENANRVKNLSELVSFIRGYNASQGSTSITAGSNNLKQFPEKRPYGIDPYKGYEPTKKKDTWIYPQHG